MRPINDNSKLNENEPQLQQQQQQTTSIQDGIGFYFKIYGLPAKFDETALKSMFNNVKFLRIVTSTPTPITSTNTNNGTTEQTITIKAKKLCQVETQLDLERALTRQDERVGKSKLQIFQISRSEFDRELGNLNKNSSYNNFNNYNQSSNDQINNSNNNNNNNNDQENNNEQQENNEFSSTNMNYDDDLYVYMHGVPFSAKEQDVRFFFQGLNLVAVNLLIDNQTQKPTGECCCQFGTKQDRDRAAEKDDQLFRNRVVKVKPATYAEYNNYLSGKFRNQFKRKMQYQNQQQQPIKSIMSLSPNDKNIPSLFQNSNSPNDNSNEYSTVNSNENDDQNDDFESNNRFDSNSNDGSDQTYENKKFNKFNNNRGINNYQRNFINNEGNNNSNNNGLKRRAYNIQYSNEDQHLSNNNNKRVKNSNFSNYNNNNNNNQFYENENDNDDNDDDDDDEDSNNNSPVLPPLPPELQKYRNRLVLFSNISYEASREDILDLVKQYSPIEQTLKIRHNDQGQPTGDAVVACLSQENAVSACMNINGSEFMGRNIKAILFSS